LLELQTDKVVDVPRLKDAHSKAQGERSAALGQMNV
jgi:hypothetical protein